VFQETIFVWAIERWCMSTRRYVVTYTHSYHYYEVVG